VAVPVGQPVMPYSVASSPAKAMTANRALARLTWPSSWSAARSGCARMAARAAGKSRGIAGEFFQKGTSGVTMLYFCGGLQMVGQGAARWEFVELVPCSVAAVYRQVEET
jgi:hypothetical protein